MLNNFTNLNLIANTFLKLNPLHQIKNPVMFTVYIGSIMATGLTIQSILIKGEEPMGFIFHFHQ